VGPRMISVVGDVDLSGDDTESRVAVRLRALEARSGPLQPSPTHCSACPRRTNPPWQP